MEKKYCIKCGVPIDSYYEVCPECGYNQNNVVERSNTVIAKENVIKLLITLIFSVGLLSASVFSTSWLIITVPTNVLYVNGSIAKKIRYRKLLKHIKKRYKNKIKMSVGLIKSEFCVEDKCKSEERKTPLEKSDLKKHYTGVFSYYTGLLGIGVFGISMILIFLLFFILPNASSEIYLAFKQRILFLTRSSFVFYVIYVMGGLTYVYLLMSPMKADVKMSTEFGFGLYYALAGFILSLGSLFINLEPADKKHASEESLR